MEKRRRNFARLYICAYIYTYIYIKFAKLCSVGYNLSTSTSQEKEHSHENKDVCVNHGIGLPPVPKQVALPSCPLPRPALGRTDRERAAGDSRDSRSLWRMPDLTSCRPCEEKALKLPVQGLSLAVKCAQLLLGKGCSGSPARAYAFYSFFSISFAQVAA